ncbi:unnamed protein product [Urochloa decumbens]|uniref:DUF7597 domain-containing protein n=1 Tax=Urochloa decumbens TaxID=240449 RepID=A0ABC9AXT1_9POAL
MIEHHFPVQVISAFPSPLGLGLFEFATPVQHQILLDASPIPFAQGNLVVQKHDEARNLRACPYIRQCWIMFLAFPLDYQMMDFVRAAIAPFGRLLNWVPGPNKSRILTNCLVLSPERVPRSVVISQGSVLGGNGRSWSLPVYILGGHFPDAFPGDEDPVPDNGNPHPVHGPEVQFNPNVPQHWHQEQVGGTVHNPLDAGINMGHMQAVQEDNAQPMDLDENAAWPEWLAQQVGNAETEDLIAQNVPQHPDQPQDTVSFDQSGSTTCYLRAHGPDINLTVEDVIQGRYGSPSDSDSSESEIQSSPPCEAFLIVERNAFKMLTQGSIHQPYLNNPILERVEIPKMPSFYIDRDLLTPVCRVVDDSLAIIPYRPTLAAILLKIWAEAHQELAIDAEDIGMSNADHISETQPLEVETHSLGLPAETSIQNPLAVLEESSVRRSTRLSQNKEGYRHIQLEDHPRKKRKIWTEAPITRKEATKLLEKALEEGQEIPSQIPNELLRAWGIECNVALEELTHAALMQGTGAAVLHEDTTE